MNWHDAAACQGLNPQLFDHLLGDDEPLRQRLARYGRAVAVCARCPVTEPCIEDRGVHDEGIRGGLLFRQGSTRAQALPKAPGRKPNKVVAS